ncbi:MAG: hypothetical protein F4Z60_12280 [Chloroflexi bacterium]|nr:hypothetical protein [Chloroflexota bacterium]
MAERNTPRRSGMIDFVEAYDVAASAKIEAGHMVALDASGNASQYAPVDGTADAGAVIVGRCEETADNGSGAAGAQRVSVRTGVFLWKNDAAGKVLTKAHIGDAVYARDSETVQNDDDLASGTDGELAQAGRLVQIDDNGAWVATGIPFLW